MKNYVSPKSVVLSMNMNENIAASYRPESGTWWINTSNGDIWAASSLKAEIYPTIDDIVALLGGELNAEALAVLNGCKKAPTDE